MSLPAHPADPPAGGLHPAEFARHALSAMEASEGRRKRRKRDTTPDRIGLDLKRELLEKIAADAPPPEGIEAWLLERILAAEARGATRAMCGEILDEYRSARFSDSFREWLERGAPSDDREDAAGPACEVRTP